MSLCLENVSSGFVVDCVSMISLSVLSLYSHKISTITLVVSVFYVAAKATYIRLLYGKGDFFRPYSVKMGRTHIVLG